MAAAFMAGIVLCRVLPFFPYTSAGAAVMMGTGAFLCRGRFRLGHLTVLCAFTAGFLLLLFHHGPDPVQGLHDGDLVIEGRIADVPEQRGDIIRFSTEDNFISGRHVAGRVRLAADPVLFQKISFRGLPGPGDSIGAVARLREPVPFCNPGVYTKDLRDDGIILSGYVKRFVRIRQGRSPVSLINRQRQRLGMIFDRSLAPESASLHKAIIPGLKGSMSSEMREAFSSVGIAHLLSISGTHFGLLAVVTFFVVKMVIRCAPDPVLRKLTLFITPLELAAVLTLPVLAGYGVLSGMSIPAVRASIMVCVSMIALLAGRTSQWLNALSVAATLILLRDPDALFHLSFILSFAAVFALGSVIESFGVREYGRVQEISALYRNGQEKHNRACEPFRKLVHALTITTAAVLATAPAALLCFQQFPLYAPLTNLVVTPAVCFIILPMGLAAGLAALAGSMEVLPFSGAVDAVTKLVLKCIGFLSELPYAALHLPDPSAAVIGAYYVSLWFLLKSGSRWRVLPIILITAWYLVQPVMEKGYTTVTFLDVGQGEAAVIELPDRKVMLIDGGAAEPDMGKRIIGPFLWSRGISRLDYVVVSHQHPDHAGGIYSVLELFDVGEIWLNRIDVHGQAVYPLARMKNIPVRIVQRGDVLEHSLYRIQVLHPYQGYYALTPRGGFSEENNRSLVLKIEAGSVSFLFTGDIEEEAEADMLYLGQLLKSDIIKVPHHGGRTSSSGSFITAVSPQGAIVSAGRNNSFNHPNPDTVARYTAAGARLYRTDSDGALTVRLNERGFRIMTCRDLQYRKVHTWGDELHNLKKLFTS